MSDAQSHTHTQSRMPRTQFCANICDGWFCVGPRKCVDLLLSHILLSSVLLFALHNCNALAHPTDHCIGVFCSTYPLSHSHSLSPCLCFEYCAIEEFSILIIFTSSFHFDFIFISTFVHCFLATAFSVDSHLAVLWPVFLARKYFTWFPHTLRRIASDVLCVDDGNVFVDDDDRDNSSYRIHMVLLFRHDLRNVVYSLV